MSGEHTDGTICLEGIREHVPEGWVACCSAFEQRTKACQYDNLRIQWYPKNGGWGVPVDSWSFICISYCPHCGTKL